MDPDAAAVQRILSAASPLPPGLAEAIAAPRHGDPFPGEVWRVGREHAELVWVRRTFDDGVADVIPLTVMTEFADQYWLMLPPEATLLDLRLGAVVAMRTHVVFEAFLNRMGGLDIDDAVEEIVTACRKGRPPVGVHTGPPVAEDEAGAFEFRQSLRGFYYPLGPGPSIAPPAR